MNACTCNCTALLLLVVLPHGLLEGLLRSHHRLEEGSLGVELEK